MRGFFVFRSTTSAGPYYQLEGLRKTNSYVDNSVARGVTYWYRVVMLKNDAMLTSLSDPKNGVHP
jgi:fibronectin type 3 domain-containing protein